MLNDLEIALLKDDTGLANDYLEEIDRRTAVKAYQKAAGDFDFKIIKIGGVCYSNMSATAAVLGYSDESGLRKLLDRYEIQAPKIGTFGVEVRLKIRATFSLSEKDGHARLLPWEGFLLVGMYGRKPEADQVKLYLLEMEKEARIAMERAQPDALAVRMTDIKEMDVVTKALGMGEKLTDVRSREILSTQLAKLTGSPLPPKQQTDLGLN